MPSQDNENAMDGLLRRSLARDSKARADCPDTELLAAYFDQALGADEAAGYELHFSTCPRCREQLAAMARASSEQVVQPDLTLEPALVGARPQPIPLDAARLRAQVKPAARSETKPTEPKSPDSRWLDLRWLIPVAAVLILGTVSLIHFGSRTKNLGLNNEVALSKPSAPPQDQGAKEADKKLESNEPQKTSPPETKKASPPVAKAKSAPKSAATDSAAPARPPAPPAASATSGGSGGVGGGGGGPTSYRGRNGGVLYYGGHAGVVRPSMPGAARTTTGSHFSSGARARVNSAPAPQVESNPAQRAAPDENSADSQNSAADQNAASQDQSAAVESAAAAPPAPAPELSAALQKMPVSSDAAEPVKSPAPAPPAAAQEKSKSTETATKPRSVNGLTSMGNFAVAKHSSTILVYTADPNVIYRIARTGGLVELSNDAGKTWQSRLLDPPADINAHSAVAPKICWLVGSSGAVFITEDGKTWRKLPPPTSKNLVEVEAKDAYRATITSEDGQKWTTDDAGDIWYPAK